MSQGANDLTLRIDSALDCLSPIPLEHCIFRVYPELRIENEKAYEPKVITIGPYHHGKDNLHEMEEYKMWYLKLLLQRRLENSVHKYVMALSEMEESARKCYAEFSSLDKDEFVNMMLIDGVFVIELFRKWAEKSRYTNDPILQLSRLHPYLCRDLLLLENQLPFFILLELFNMTRDPNTQEDFSDLALYFLNSFWPQPTTRHDLDIPKGDVKHLLHLVHRSMCISFAKEVESDNDGIGFDALIKTSTELQEFGIEFKAIERSDSLFDIKFDKGLMKIPRLTIQDDTESILRNLIAYEQFLPYDTHRRYVTDYAFFMDCLVNSPKDATILRCHEIIVNGVGDDIVVCNMFNKLGNSVSFAKNFNYSQVFNNVNKHCKSPYNKWMANLKRNYFNSPWALVSFLAAIVLLLLTVAQTIFSAISYF